MIRPNRRRLRRIGLVMIVASLVLFGVSALVLSHGTSEYSITVKPGSSSVLNKPGVSTGDDLTYKVSFYQNVNVTANLMEPNGTVYSSLSFYTMPTGSNSLLASVSGNWTLQIVNNGGYAVNLSLSLDNLNHNPVLINPGSKVEFYTNNVQSDSNIQYSMGLNLNPDLHTSLVSPDGTVHSYLNLTSVTSGSHTIIVPASGTWGLHVDNNGSLPVNVSVTIGDASYAALGMTIFGFVLLPSGIALIVVHVYAARQEKKRNRLRGFSE